MTLAASGMALATRAQAQALQDEEDAQANALNYHEASGGGRLVQRLGQEGVNISASLEAAQ